MLNRFLRWCKGYVRICLNGYSPERFLNLCKANGIRIWDLESAGLAYEMTMSVRDFKRLRPFLRKTNSRIRVRQRIGFPFLLYRNRKRKMFFLGSFLACACLFCLSFFIWNIHIEGNISLSEEVLLEYLAEEHVVHGMAKADVNSEAIRTGLRIRFPDIVWVSAEIRGTRLIIHMKENRDGIAAVEETEKEDIAPAHIVAAKGGLLTQVLTRTGVPKVAAGETVEAGQLLISGDVEILDDSGTVVGHQYVRADASVFARTSYKYRNSFPLSHEEKVYTGRKHRTFYVKLGEQYFALWPLPDNFSKSSSFSEEYPLHLTENFYLPVIFGYLCEEEYEISRVKYTKTEAETLANANLNEFLQKLMQKGVQIIENSVKINTSENHCTAEGVIYTLEEIGRTETWIPEAEESLGGEPNQETR